MANTLELDLAALREEQAKMMERHRTGKEKLILLVESEQDARMNAFIRMKELALMQNRSEVTIEAPPRLGKQHVVDIAVAEAEAKGMRVVRFPDRGFNKSREIERRQRQRLRAEAKKRP